MSAPNFASGPRNEAMSNAFAMAPALDGSSPPDILFLRRLTVREAAWLCWLRASRQTWDAMWWCAGWHEVGHA